MRGKDGKRWESRERWKEDGMEREIGLERKEGKGGNINSRRREKVRARWGEGKERNGKEGKGKWKGERNE